ncbi:MAG: cytochrome b/b6 domain-containing protein [Methylovulum sp.]|uniref:cytochrome b/b6 domain-containing protein n=1 Tax=Methylovulum sp. TaxID=1916980 RepID=UPI0026186BD7|nr:cytochrome b/b6 domain-containing protein [Methylovulum sp.]MDD2724374.1 cytochrome b/b6 domain-containing protein [Methylovulum sp.]MDD5124202.1 cytochrome b/b6 domain-containing protein [Methylovulum sp.]
MKVTVRIWDFPIRLFHWLLVLAVVAAYVTATLGGNLMDWHGRIGSFILGLLIFRLIWGFIGSTYARFGSFLPTLPRLAAYLRGRWYGIGHNPLGALAVFALLADLSLLVGTGLCASDDIAFEGPFYQLVDDESSRDKLSGLHVQAFNFLLVLVALHIASIVFYRVVKKTNLVVPMLTGKKEVPKALATTVIGGGVFRFLTTVIISGAVVWGVWEGVEIIKPVESAPVTATPPSF